MANPLKVAISYGGNRVREVELPDPREGFCREFNARNVHLKATARIAEQAAITLFEVRRGKTVLEVCQSEHEAIEFNRGLREVGADAGDVVPCREGGDA